MATAVADPQAAVALTCGSTSLEPTKSLHRYNACLPSSYRHQLAAEQTLQLAALRSLASAIIGYSDEVSTSEGTSPRQPEDPATAECYERGIERDLAAFEKGLSRYLDLKYPVPADDYSVFVSVMLRGALTYSVDMGLRSKLARSVCRVAGKRDCVLPDGISFRPVLQMIKRVHLDCVDGGPFIGKDVRDAHCRTMLALLRQCREHIPADESADRIYAEFGSLIEPSTPEKAFEHLLILAHVLPTRGSAALGWVPDALLKFATLPNAPEWDAAWMGLFCRVAKNQPGRFDWSDHLPYIFSRIVAAFKLPLGSAAPQHPVERRCPHHCQFLLADRMTSAGAVMVAHTLSPLKQGSMQQFRRMIALVANFFHPSNGGRWTSNLGSFLHQFSVSLASRVVHERAATEAGVMDRVLGDAHKLAIPPLGERLTPEMVDEVVSLLLPLIQQGLQSKSGSMTIQAASASRDLAVIAPHVIVQPLLGIAAECLESVSSPHRTSAALKMLAALTPVFLDPELCPDGAAALPQALTLTLPGIDPNDPGKTESTLRFIAGAAARIQSMLASGESSDLSFFVEDYTHQLLERVFALLDTLEAPPKKGRNGSVPSSASPQLSAFIFAVSMDNLFAAVPASVARDAAERVARQITGAASMNALKCYGALVRSVASAAASSSEGGSSTSIFIPRLLDQLLTNTSSVKATSQLELASLSEDEIVWRLRMLAQVCRSCGEGLEMYSDRICKLVSLAFGRSERPVYKAGGRLLRGLLEGLTAVRTVLDSVSDACAADAMSGTGSGGGGGNFDDGAVWDIKWKVPSDAAWKLGEDIVSGFLTEVQALVKGSDGEVVLDRDVLFRGLRLLHATQRGARWIMAGVTPKRFSKLEEYSGGDIVMMNSMTKSEAILALRKPTVAGLGGERDDPRSAQVATDLWTQAYSLTLDIIMAVVANRPDDGALLYRCLEPLELAHEPFRRSNQGRLSSHACQGYKAAYHPVIAVKRPFTAVGGVGRGMPRFIFKLRIEAQHEYRLSLGARGGADNEDLFNQILSQVTSLALNAFPLVRGEARGILTRSWRVAHPTSRRENVERVIDALSNAAAETEVAQKLKAEKSVSSTSPAVTAQDTSDTSDLQYEIMIGASSVLRSAAAAPSVMRDWSLFDRIARVLLQAIVVAERPDASAAVGSLFAKLAGLARPLSYLPFRLVGPDLFSADLCPASNGSSSRLEEFQALNLHLIGMIYKPSSLSPSPGVEKQGSVEGDGKEDEGSSTLDAHWRLQSLVATVLTICLREDCPPSPDVAKFFAESMVSDVVSLRHISARAVALILAMHGRKPAASFGGEGGSAAVRTDDVPRNPALSAIEDVLQGEGFGRRLVHTLALDHDDGMGLDGNSGGSTARSFGVYNFSRYVDGDACWSMISGRPWPSSWVSRSRDTLNIVQIRLYEALCRVYGKVALSVLGPVLDKLVLGTDAKEEKIIDGVRDENVRVIAGELVAGMARGFSHTSDGNSTEECDQVMMWTEKLLNGFTGPTGAVNGGTLIRLVLSASPGTVGSEISSRIVSSVISHQPIVVAMDTGTAAHVQARRLRYAHACLADLLPEDDNVAVEVMKVVVKDLTSPVAFGHELKNVREEVARLMSMLATFKCPEASQLYEAAVEDVGARQRIRTEEANVTLPGEADDERESRKKFRSRQGETLSRWISVLYWNGDALGFSKYLPVLMPAIVSSLDEETDSDRVSHARLALSLAAQGSMAPSSMLNLVRTGEQISKSPRYRVRGALLPFIQVLSFSLLFTADSETLDLMLQIVTALLSDPQLEVREAAAGTFVPFIRDAPVATITDIRDRIMGGLRKTKKRAPRGQKVVLTSEQLRSRHGAVLGLGSMVASSPYDVPEWMPSVLVALTDFINDPPPISTSTRKIFADFMRTHRDEWQTHKLAFSEDDLERVSELMVSPSYYA